MILLTYLRLSIWLHEKLIQPLHEERGVSSIEGIALVAVVFMTLTACLVYLMGPGRATISNALNTSLGQQLGRWR